MPVSKDIVETGTAGQNLAGRHLLFTVQDVSYEVDVLNVHETIPGLTKVKGRSKGLLNARTVSNAGTWEHFDQATALIFDLKPHE